MDAVEGVGASDQERILIRVKLNERHGRLFAEVGSDALAGWQIRRQEEVDRKLRFLRSTGAERA